ncbi:hypothetical protein HPP92_009192 [Vanilla planifolia]|uniref:Uncharacterized protein n=1 Tax=Vanilla planifolia TaxID=51239 RepID=A0A835RJ98_VANPL|nr:hypothetical protein HPP92_009192 [Vanilla planifolia]
MQHTDIKGKRVYGWKAHLKDSIKPPSLEPERTEPRRSFMLPSLERGLEHNANGNGKRERERRNGGGGRGFGFGAVNRCV